GGGGGGGMGGLVVSGLIATILQATSGGAWLDHLVRATGQPMSLRLWAEQVPSRLQFLGAPLALAACAAHRERADAGMRIAFFALVASFLWTLVSLAKIGSATNYCIQPVV